MNKPCLYNRWCQLLAMVLGLLGAGHSAAIEMGSGIYAADCADETSQVAVQIFGNEIAEVFVEGQKFTNLEVSRSFLGHEPPRDFYKALIFPGDLAPIGRGPGGERWLEIWLNELGFSMRVNGDAANTWQFCGNLPRGVSQGRTGFDCTFAQHPVEILICSDRNLGELNYRLTQTLRNAESRAQWGERFALSEEQSNWDLQRSKCWESADRNRCIERETLDRTATLSARYDLVRPGRKSRYRCVSWIGEWVYATPYSTFPATMKLARGNSSEVALLRSGSNGGRYVAESGVTFAALGPDQALIEWPAHKLHRCWKR